MAFLGQRRFGSSDPVTEEAALTVAAMLYDYPVTAARAGVRPPEGSKPERASHFGLGFRGLSVCGGSER